MGSTNDGGGEDEDVWEKEMEQYGCSKPNNWEWKVGNGWQTSEWVVRISTMGIASAGKQQWMEGGLGVGGGREFG